MTARHHHYLPQFYLKGFTKGQTKKSELVVINSHEKKTFQTTPRNVGGIRDFNRIDIEGVDQNQLESDLGEFEGEAARALKNLEEILDFSGKTKRSILYLMALIAIRSPEERENMRQFRTRIAEILSDTTHTHDPDKLRASQIAKIKKDYPNYDSKMLYKKGKESFRSKQYPIKLSREHYIYHEMNLVKELLPYLSNRKWLLLKANDTTGPFIATNCPVNLLWKEPDKVPIICRKYLSFGDKGTQVYFPVSQNVALIGEFDGNEGILEGTKERVSELNAVMVYSAQKQIYSPIIDFKYLGKNNEILSGEMLIKDTRN